MERDWKAYALKLEAAMQSALNRYDREDKLRAPSGLSWAMADDLRAVLSEEKPKERLSLSEASKQMPHSVFATAEPAKCGCSTWMDHEAGCLNPTELAPTTEAAPSEYDIALFRKYEDAAVQNADLTLRLANAIALSDARLGGGTKLMAENAELKRQLAAAQSRVDAAEFRAEKAIALLKLWAQARQDLQGYPVTQTNAFLSGVK